MSEHNSNGNTLVYLLAGFGLGALVGAAAGLMYAPKEGKAIREDVGNKFKEIKGKTNEWVSEQRAKRQHAALGSGDGTEEVGA